MWSEIVPCREWNCGDDPLKETKVKKITVIDALGKKVIIIPGYDEILEHEHYFPDPLMKVKPEEHMTISVGFFGKVKEVWFG